MWLISLIAALSVGNALFFSLTYLFTALLLFSFLWAWLNVNLVRLTRQIRTRYIQAGDFIEERFVIENTSRIPKLWLELKDYSQLPNHRASRVVSNLGGKRQQSWHVRTPTYQRGRFRLGPITLSSGDPDLLSKRQLTWWHDVRQKNRPPFDPFRPTILWEGDVIPRARVRGGF
jgi:uncharacterized protein (DUF58 family)